MNLAEGYITKLGLDENSEIIGYEYVNIGNFMQLLSNGDSYAVAMEKSKKVYGRFNEAVKVIDPRKE